MQPRIEILKEKKLIGLKLKMSLGNYNISALWKYFAKHRHKIKDNISNDLISVAVYDSNYFEDFKPTSMFERWAALEVSSVEKIPEELESFVIPSGLYAVFEYKGLHTDKSIYQYIFQNWLPNSEYKLDDRPHFEILGKNYKNNDPNSEEEIWVPVQENV